ncbi:MAG: hypothetical protein ACRD5L_08055 [Bryobacteraceae bacterium]
MTRTLTAKEKRTITVAAAGIAIYLLLFFGPGIWTGLHARRTAYRARLQEVADLRAEIQPYEDKVLVIKKLMGTFQMDPVKLNPASVVADASAAIQRAATGGGVEAGPIRESAGRPSNKELASIQFEGSGPIAAVMALLHNLQSTGYPLVIDSMQLSTDPRRPNGVKVTMTITVVDFAAWKKETKPNA